MKNLFLVLLLIYITSCAKDNCRVCVTKGETSAIEKDSNNQLLFRIFLNSKDERSYTICNDDYIPSELDTMVTSVTYPKEDSIHNGSVIIYTKINKTNCN